MATFAQRKTNFDDYYSELEKKLKDIEAAKKKHLEVVAQSMEESKNDLKQT